MLMYPPYRTMDKVDATMAAVNEQRELANEVAEAISNPLNAGIDVDEVRVYDSYPIAVILTVLIG
jgi:hypothetical protein